jgi:hypothetical protein
MSYESKPNEATLWANQFKTTNAHPTKKGQLLITRALLIELSEQQGKGGDFLVDVSAWERTTKSGKEIINIKVEKPYKFGEQEPAPKYKAGTPPEHYAPEVIREPSAHQSPPKPKAPPTPEKYLAALKDKIANITEYPDFEGLYKKINSPEVWEVFKQNTAIAQQASSILSAKKGELILATAPVDLSSIISAIDVECDRLKLGKKEHCLIRWNKPRAMLTHDELQIYLDELRSAEYAPPKQDDFF